MNVLGIETTCDETGASIVIDGQTILSNVIASSADLHERYGGVFPELASRRHIECILPVIKEALKKANFSPEEIDLIAVAKEPGLIGSLLIGLQFAKGLSIAWGKPWVGVNHVQAHLYAAMMGHPQLFPALGLVLSGGHTLLWKLTDITEYEQLGTTVDDAIGETFDKVASLLGLSYPGGPQVEALAKEGDPRAYLLKPGNVKNAPLNFSFSGLKTSILYAIKGQNNERPKNFSLQEKKNLAASFQETAFQDIVAKTKKALAQFPYKAIYLGGGVCNNQRLRILFQETFSSLPIYFPSFDLTLDNAAMIAGLGFHKFSKNRISDPLDLEALPRVRG